MLYLYLVIGCVFVERIVFLRIGNLQFETGAALAPLAGVSDAPMRALCVREGAVYTVSEMVSAKALCMGDAKSLRLLRGATKGAPYAVQLFGNDADVLAQAVKHIENEQFDFLDLNLGCPAPKIVSNGSGSALLKEPKKAAEFVEAGVKASVRPVSVKIRIGWDKTCMTGLEVAKACEQAGAAFLVVHARTREEQYTPGVHHDAVAAIKAAVSIPVLYNGDVVDGESALQALRNTGCDGLMIGRGAMGNPFVFKEVAAALKGESVPQANLTKRMAALEWQVREMCEEKGESVAMRAARGVAGAYMHGLRGAASLRRQAFSLTYFSDLAPLIEEAYRLQETEG